MGDLGSESGVSFGPGMDLVFGLFSVAVLLMIIGALIFSMQAQVLTQQVITLSGKKPVLPLQCHRPHLPAQKKTLPALGSKEKPKQVWVLDQNNYFEINSAVLTYQGRAMILDNVTAIRNLLRRTPNGVIQIAGFASPEPRQSGDGNDSNLDLSGARALSVAHYLADLGIPYTCMMTIGYGRGRSQSLGRWLNSASDRRLSDWDRLKVYDRMSPRFLSQERRVLISVTRESEAICSICPKR